MRKLRSNNSSTTSSWSLFLVIALALLSHGRMKKGIAMTVEDLQAHAKEAIMETFEVDGEIIDCIDIYKQIAFQHPLLVNHTIQMKPTYYPEAIRYPETNGTNNDPLSTHKSHPWELPKSCPDGSIPIRRARGINKHIRDGPSASHLHQRGFHSLRQKVAVNQRSDPQQHEHSFVEASGGKFYGGKAEINACSPKLETPDEFSISQLWVTSSDIKISLEAGWMVYPALYDDYKTRFFTLWTVNGYESFCYNLQCPGFVQTNQRINLGTSLQPLSVYDGQQYDVEVEIFLDRNTGNWWVRLQGQDMGYWPKVLVPSFAQGADLITFGGEVLNLAPPGRHTSTQMGTGHFSREGFRKASFFKKVQVIKAQTPNTYVSPEKTRVNIERPKCYDLEVGKNLKGNWGYFFFYGGPGGSCT